MTEAKPECAFAILKDRVGPAPCRHLLIVDEFLILKSIEAIFVTDPQSAFAVFSKRLDHGVRLPVSYVLRREVERVESKFAVLESVEPLRAHPDAARTILDDWIEDLTPQTILFRNRRYYLSGHPHHAVVFSTYPERPLAVFRE